MDITNRTVFIAGATSGIGLELARRFAAAGSAVIVGGRRTGLLGKLAAEGFAAVPIDVTDTASTGRARDTILLTHPGLDTIVTLRAQLDGTGVEVCELVPPAVATRPEAKQRNPRALDLAEFATEVMDLLQADPTPQEILVKGVLMHRWAERDGRYTNWSPSDQRHSRCSRAVSEQFP